MAVKIEYDRHRYYTSATVLFHSRDYTSAMPEPRLYQFSVHNAACNKQSRTFVDLAEKLKMDVVDLMRQVNGHAPPSKALVKGLARELDISESYLDKRAEEVRKDLGPK
jgi:hypothetical protein